jgi:membrane protease subunit HflC
MRSSIKSAILTILIIAAFITLTGSFFTLEEGKQAIIVQFGKPIGGTITDAGLHFKLPFVQEVRIFEKRLLV